jgi:hypothetical protein
VCQAALLQKASKEDLRSKIKLSPDAADAVKSKVSASPMKSFSDLKKEIPSDEFLEITVKLDGLKDADFKGLAQKYGTTNVEVKADGSISSNKPDDSTSSKTNETSKSGKAAKK